MRIVKAGATYWAVIFALGIVLGTVRVMWGAAALGEGNFLLLEIPVMLAASWLAARDLVPRYQIETGRAALLMGAFAFALLMVAEVGLAAGPGGMGAREWLAGIARVPGVYGFLGQVAFGLMPWLVLKRG